MNTADDCRVQACLDGSMQACLAAGAARNAGWLPAKIPIRKIVRLMLAFAAATIVCPTVRAQISRSFWPGICTSSQCVQQIVDISTPANPPSGSTKFYTKSGVLCSLSPAGTESCTSSGGGGGATALSAVTAAVGTNTITNGDNAQLWNWATTTSGRVAMIFGETTASTSAGTPYILQAKTLIGSTATPLNVQNSLNGSQTLSALSITPTWNTTGVVDAALLVNPTNTASGAASKLIDAQVGGTTQWSVDKAGNSVQVGSVTTGSGSGVAGTVQIGQGTLPSNGTTAVQLVAPTSVTSYQMVVPSAAATGFVLNTDASNTDTWSFVGFTGTSTVVRSASPTLSGTPAAPTPAATDNSTTLATTAYVTTGIANAVNAAAGRDLVQAATAAVLPNTPTFTHVDAGVGSFFTSSTNSVLVVDGYTPLLNDRILVKNQATAANNGIYKVTQLGVAAVTPWIMTRALDYDQPGDMNNTIVPVAANGTANPLTSWIMTSTVATVDTDAVNFAAFTPAGANIVTAVSPGVGLCHFAGSTQTCTSSAVNLATADVTGVLATANIPVALVNQTSINGSTVPSAAGLNQLSQTVASGTSAMGTGAISSATCATVVTTSATGTATTDVVLAGFNGDPTAVTGYIPATAGMLTIIGYPSSGNVNFKVCNNTSSSITPGAITLNWRVIR